MLKTLSPGQIQRSRAGQCRLFIRRLTLLPCLLVPVADTCRHAGSRLSNISDAAWLVGGGVALSADQLSRPPAKADQVS